LSAQGLVTGAALVPAALAAGILIWFLVKRPPLYARATIVAMLLGLGVFPIGTATVGNLHGFEQTKQLEFCGGCHVMKPWIEDATNPESGSLASLHTRNEHTGGEACYSCHADYSMYGTLLTKVQGSKHMYKYWVEGFRSMEIDAAVARIEISKPYPNSSCMQCHSTWLPGWNDEPEHGAVAEDVRAGTTSCAAAGCHGPAHRVKLPSEEGTGS
jgi:nitrate/TMAO reductase-like tetraheme cytochrome c subunit